MSHRKGFTLIEIIVVLMIVSILAFIALPNYSTQLVQGAANAAQNNLMTIYNAQKSYYLGAVGNGSYYNSPSSNDLPGIDTTLGLTITDNNFKYTCATAAGPSYTCTATNNSNTSLILTVTSGTPSNPDQIVLPGGSTCASNTGANPGCNPSCATNVAAYCPA